MIIEPFNPVTSTCFVIIVIMLILIIRRKSVTTVERPLYRVALSQAAVIEAEKRANERQRIRNCLWEGICPKCSKDLTQKHYGSYDQFTDSECPHCGFKSLCDVLA